jgi:hypothetical protein
MLIHRDMRWPIYVGVPLALFIAIGGLALTLLYVFRHDLLLPLFGGELPPAGVAILAGFVWLLLGPVALYSARLHLRAHWAYKMTQPVPMKLLLKVHSSSDSTSYDGELSGYIANSDTWIGTFHSPNWDARQVQDRQTGVRVYLDPKSGVPLVVETDRGRLWTGSRWERMTSSSSSVLRQ